MATHLAASALWDWIRTKIKGRSAAATEAVDEVEKAPADPVNWDVLRLQLRKALAQDETVRTELAALLAKHAPVASAVQNSTIAGVGNVGIQNTGTGNISVQH